MSDEMEQMSLEEMRAEATRLQDANNAALEALTRQQVQLDPNILTGVRMGVLLEMVLGPADGEAATRERLMYELACQQRFEALMNDVMAQVRKQQLLAGVQGANLPMGNGGRPAGR